MELNTLLWTLSYPMIRQQHPHPEVKRHIEAAMEGLTLASDRWPGVLSALQLYRSLIQGCLQAYRSETSYVVSSPSTKASPSSTNELSPRSAYSPDSHTSFTEASTASTPPNPQFGYIIDPPRSTPIASAPTSAPAPTPGHVAQQPTYSQSSSPHGSAHQQPQAMFSSSSSSMIPMDSSQTSLPPFSPAIQQWNNENPFGVPGVAWPGMANVPDERSWLGSIGDEYSRYLHQSLFAAPQRQFSLSQQQQSELMATLESDQLPDMQPLLNDARTYYSSALT